jgi:hypothetical protein
MSSNLDPGRKILRPQEFAQYGSHEHTDTTDLNAGIG